MLLTLDVRHLLIASWPVTEDDVARVLPAPLAPAAVDGEHLVSLVALRYSRGRLGRLPVPPFSQLNTRVYVEWQGEPAVLFLDARVTPPGLAGTLLGAPYRSAWLRLGRGRADAGSLGLRLRYEVDGPADAGALGRHELGLYQHGGRSLRAFRIRRGPAEWRAASPTERPRVDPLLAQGFDLARPPELLYTEGTSFSVEVPPRALGAGARSSRSRSAR